MQKLLKLWIGSAFALAGTAAMAQQIQVVVNGSPVEFAGQGPEMSGDRVLVPLRGVLEKMGAHVGWNPSTQTVTADRGRRHVSLAIGQNTASVDGQPVNLDVPAQIVNGSTMVPLRFVGEALGGNVHWDSATSTVDIKDSGDYNIPPPQPRPRLQQPPPQQPSAAVLPAGIVIPVQLQEDLGSDRSQSGNRFSATVVADTVGIPDGTSVEGIVLTALAMNRNHPGMLDLRFDHLIMPNGHRYNIRGSLIPLSGDAVEHRGNRIYARPEMMHSPGAWAGIGSNVIIRLAPDRHMPVSGDVIVRFGGARVSRPVWTNVHLLQGTQFGVRFDQPVTLDPRDLR